MGRIGAAEVHSRDLGTTVGQPGAHDPGATGEIEHGPTLQPTLQRLEGIEQRRRIRIGTLPILSRQDASGGMW